MDTYDLSTSFTFGHDSLISVGRLSHAEGLVTDWGLGIRLVRRNGYGFLPSISGCPIGLAAKTTFQFIGNNVHDMNNTTNMYLAGVLVDPGGGSMADVAGQFVNNTFTISTPAYNGDIACTATDEATRGSGNRDNGADVKCEGCMYCPFH